MNVSIIAAILAMVRVCSDLGDYVLQNHQMAIRKTTSWRWASIHAAFYMIPFVVLYGFMAGYTGVTTGWALVGLLVQGVTHAVIDHTQVAARWCRWYGIGVPGRFYVQEEGHAPTSAPEWLQIWLKIRADNAFHAVIDTLCVAGTLWICTAGAA